MLTSNLHTQISMHQFSPCSTESVSIPTDPDIQGIPSEHSSAVLRRDDDIQQSMFADHIYSMIHLQPFHILHLTSPSNSKLDLLESLQWMQVDQCMNVSTYSHNHCLCLAVFSRRLQVEFSQHTTSLLWARIPTNCKSSKRY